MQINVLGSQNSSIRNSAWFLYHPSSLYASDVLSQVFSKDMIQSSTNVTNPTCLYTFNRSAIEAYKISSL